MADLTVYRPDIFEGPSVFPSFTFSWGQQEVTMVGAGKELSVESFVAMIMRTYFSSCKKKEEESEEILKLGRNHLVSIEKQWAENDLFV